MPIDEQIKEAEEAAKKIWAEIKQRQDVYLFVEDFSPQSLWIIDRLFKSPRQHEDGGLLHFSEPVTTRSPAGIIQRKNRIFELGAYVGEVVRQHYGKAKCKWVEDGNKEELHFHQPISVLQLPNGKIVSPPPMKLIEDQLKDYKSGSIVQWGRDAGLQVGDCPKLHNANFRNPV